MIDNNKWTHNGHWGDDNTPPVETQLFPLFGSRISPTISLEPAIELLGEIIEARLYYECDTPNNMSVECYVQLDNEDTWELIMPGEIIPGIHRAASLRIKIILRSTYSEVAPNQSPLFKSLVIVAYKDGRAWTSQDLFKLKWKGDWNN